MLTLTKLADGVIDFRVIDFESSEQDLLKNWDTVAMSDAFWPVLTADMFVYCNSICGIQAAQACTQHPRFTGRKWVWTLCAVGHHC